jgi:4-alpha-glucanotransferase
LIRKLRELAQLYGIHTSYIDMTKQRRDADPDALLLVLRAMRAGVNSIDDVPDALQRRKEELRNRTVEPVMVAWDGKLGKQRFELGYHVTEIKGRETFVISAPRRAYFPGEEKNEERGRDSSPPPRSWGVFAPVYSLHSKRNPQAGDLTDFENLMDWMHTLGGSVAGTLPLLGAFLNEPFEPSPYSPATRLFWNEFYIDVEHIPEFTDGARSASAAAHSRKNRPPLQPKKANIIDYRRLMSEKRRVLEELSRTFFSNAEPDRMLAFRKFIHENEGVEDYARFRAATDHQRRGWHGWPARLRDGTIRHGDYDEETKNYYLYSQWIIQEQLRSLSQRAASRGQFLYLDLPLGLHSESYDGWRDREFFIDGITGGAPPDPVFTKGQNWGFPPMNPEAMRRNRYQYVIAYLRNHFRYAKLLRIDHVMGLYRLYWIPNELTADKGVYVEYPAEELWAILSLESHRYKGGIVGENLGTVPPEVNAAMAKHDIREMYVVQYEIMGDPEHPTLPPPPEKCVASLNTHDMPPFRAFLDGADIDDRLDLGFIDDKTARKERKQRARMQQIVTAVCDRRSHAKSPAVIDRGCRGILQFLSESMANIVLVNVEDLWGETLPQNVPATSTERPNWRRRMRPSVEQIRKMAGIGEVLSNVFAQRSRSLPV